MPWNDDVMSEAEWRQALRQAANANTWTESYQTTFFTDSSAGQAQSKAAATGVRLRIAITDEVRKYHAVAKDQIQSRIVALGRMVQACIAFSDEQDRTPSGTYIGNAATFRAVKALQDAAASKRKYLDTIKSITEQRLPSLEDVIERRYTLAALTGHRAIGLDMGYWIEQTHPAHATSQVSRALGTLFGQWEREARAGRTSQHFYIWLECNDRLASVAEPALQVEYLQAADRQAYLLSVRDGLVHRPRSRADLTPIVYDTTGYDDKMATFVIAPDSSVYSGEHERGLVHHSTFLAGGKVICAGMILVQKGRTAAVTPKSGHYKAGMGDFLRGLQVLQDAGIIGESTLVDLEFWKNLYVANVPVEDLPKVLDDRGRMRLGLSEFRDWATDQVRDKNKKAVAWAREQQAAHRESKAKALAYMLIMKRYHVGLLGMIDCQARLGLSIAELERNVTESSAWERACLDQKHPLNKDLALRVLRITAHQIRQGRGGSSS